MILLHIGLISLTTWSSIYKEEEENNSHEALGSIGKTGITVVAYQKDVSRLVVDVKVLTAWEAEPYLYIRIITGCLNWKFEGFSTLANDVFTATSPQWHLDSIFHCDKVWIANMLNLTVSKISRNYFNWARGGIWKGTNYGPYLKFV